MKKYFRMSHSVLRRVCAASGAFVRVLVGNEYVSRSYSQFGEDMVLTAVFGRYLNNYSGFYIDIGAHHPMRFSNSRIFYERGWTGICVDPLPGSKRCFSRWRPRDIFLQAGVAEEEGMMTYFMYDEPAMNTFSEKVANENANLVKRKVNVSLYPLRRILTDYLPAGRVIDFLSVDVEGLDLDVLRSNDWTHFRPRIVCIEEASGTTLADVEHLKISIFMKSQKYRAFARTPNAMFYVDMRLPVDEDGRFLQFTS